MFGAAARNQPAHDLASPGVAIPWPASAWGGAINGAHSLMGRRGMPAVVWGRASLESGRAREFLPPPIDLLWNISGLGHKERTQNIADIDGLRCCNLIETGINMFCMEAMHQ